MLFLVTSLVGAAVAESLHLHTRDTTLPLRITNNCNEAIWPAILTQGGTGPASSGFMLASGDTNPQTTSGQGGAPCTTGDCGNFLECQGAGAPATLAEFTMSSDTSQTFYDISLVDGYNIPVGIISLLDQTDNSTLQDIPPNLTNPVCIGTSSLLAAVGDAADVNFGSNSTYPLPLEQSVTQAFVSSWCPWPLQLDPPQKPGDGVYPYPDDNIQRPIFNPCLSACAKYNKDQYCCTGSHDTPATCSPSDYSTQAKKVCPDAYSYAYDDQTSTFIIPQGGGFEVVFCPSGRSSNILAVFGDQLRQIAQTGSATEDIVSLAQNATYIQEKSGAAGTMGKASRSLVAVVAVLLILACL
ncbi:thaumatin family-domain-containing protein [Exophiala viscosa]|uniref:Thaumatin family-domain-containing protein n=1 Tax=Exophiala viscosa TaxID=2486360 RepID=A0AAN6DR31_9EURO|nr:thaumatin family-domain-containing protein [Exophiala viscosa]